MMQYVNSQIGTPSTAGLVGGAFVPTAEGEIASIINGARNTLQSLINVRIGMSDTADRLLGPELIGNSSNAEVAPLVNSAISELADVMSDIQTVTNQLQSQAFRFAKL